MSRIPYLATALVVVAICLFSVSSTQATSGVFPDTPFNGMQITHSIMRADLGEPPTDTWSLASIRDYVRRSGEP